MYGQNLNTPSAERYRTAQWGSEDERSYTSHPYKTYSVNKSTEIGSHSPYRSTAVSRLEVARKTIDQVIHDLEDKKQMNEEALKQVRSVNSEIIEDFRKNSRYESRDESRAENVYKYANRTAHASACDFNAAQDDTLILRGQLNEEMRRNNEILLRLSRVEQENKILRRDNQLSFGPTGNHYSLQAENVRLRQKLSEIQNLPAQILGEIQALKKENQFLRGDTVRLLRKQSENFI